MNKKALWEACKEPLRLAVLLIVAELVVFLVNIPQTYAILLLILLKGVDKFLHELGSVKEESILTKGLTRF